jgi:hypothetical protein
MMWLQWVFGLFIHWETTWAADPLVAMFSAVGPALL